MSRPAPTDETIKARKKIAKEFKSFRKNFKITQRALADLMREPGDDSAAGCRRTIQMIESGSINPHQKTLDRFYAVKKQTEEENS